MGVGECSVDASYDNLKPDPNVQNVTNTASEQDEETPVSNENSDADETPVSNENSDADETPVSNENSEEGPNFLSGSYQVNSPMNNMMLASLAAACALVWWI